MSTEHDHNHNHDDGHSHDHDHDHNHDESEVQHDHHDENPRPGYFRRGEITMLVTHDRNLDWPTWLATVSASLPYGLELVAPILYDPNDDYQDAGEPVDVALSAQAKSSDAHQQSVSHHAEKQAVELPPRPVTTFPGQTKPQVQSLVHAQLVDKPDSDKIFDAPEKWPMADAALVEMVNGLNALAPTCIDDVILHAAAPNWLLGAGNHTFLHAGPGGVPVPEPGTTINPPEMYQFDKSDLNRLIGGCEGSRNVTVVILDTIPPRQNVAPDAPASAQAHNGAFGRFPNHPVVQNLLPPITSALRAANIGLRLPPNPQEADDYASNNHNYDVTDHGSFIAGVVRDFAPDANIHMVEVLNHRGVGTTDVFCEALRKLTDGSILPRREQFDRRNWSLIVNCSLMMDIPAPDENGQIKFLNHDDKGNPSDPRTYAIFNSSDLLLAPFQAALDAFHHYFSGYDVQIVAASGNDSLSDENLRPDDPLPNPRPAAYPAAFCHVLGVGALDSNGKRAVYSNLADNPPWHGVAVFGGSAIQHPLKTSQTAVNGHWNETSKTGGMLGLYVGGFPQMNVAAGQASTTPGGHHPEPITNPSVNGWGRWSGTSFSAGVVSGVLAFAARNGCQVAVNGKHSFIQRLHADPATKRTPYGEAVIPTRQGTTVQGVSPLVRVLESIISILQGWVNRLTRR